MSLRSLAFIAVALLVPCVAAAAELGRLTVLSGVGEPLRAEIELAAVAPGETAALVARIPPADVFWRANLEPAPVIGELRVAVERRPHGRYVVAIRSNGPIADPFIQLLVELASPAGSVVREYPFLLEESRPRRPQVETGPAPSPMFSRGDAVSLPVAPRGEGYVVKAGDTLATIAAAVRPAGVSLEQMIVALYQANEAAFLDGNMNRIRASAALTPPAEDAARAIDPAFARSSILEHRAAFEAYQRRLAGAAAARTPAAAATGAPAAPAPSAAAPGDRLRLSRGDERKAGAADGAAREDDLAALQRALGETKERIAALEKNVADLTALLTLRNRELARLQRDAQVTGRQFASLATDSDAPRDPAEPDDARSLVQSLAAHANWLAAALVLGFVAWVLMPFKTLRLWLKRRRRAARQARRVRARVRRAAHRAGLLPSSALSSV